MAELDAEEAKLIEAEEEELWVLTLQQQSRHIQVNHQFAPQRFEQTCIICFVANMQARIGTS